MTEFVEGQRVIMTKEGRERLRPHSPIFAGTVIRVDGDELHIVPLFGSKAQVYHRSYWRPYQP